MTFNPEEADLEDNHRYGFSDKEREREFEENYGRKPGSRAYIKVEK
jgi:hypothetical protein